MEARPYLSSLHVSRLRPFLSLVIVVSLMSLAYYLGYSSTPAIKVVESNPEVVATDTETNITENIIEEDRLVTRSLGIFNNESYFLEWTERVSSKDKEIIGTGTLKKFSFEAQSPVIVGQNINLGSEIDNISVSNLTLDSKVIILSLICEECEKRELALNLESGRVMDMMSIASSVKQRSKLVDCVQIPFSNFIQNNLLFICKNESDVESLFSYNLSTYSVSEEMVLEENETFNCLNNVNQPYDLVYENEILLLSVCTVSSNDEVEVDQQVKVKDI